MKNFSSVSTTSARFQDISLNPTKLAGMCAKLKCCLNYEIDQYLEANRKMPSREISLYTADAEYFLFKTDILNGQCTYSTEKTFAANIETITAERAKYIIEMNKHGEKPLSLTNSVNTKTSKKHLDLLSDGDINRFDKEKKNKKQRITSKKNKKQNIATIAKREGKNEI